jgi:hypothetical protein
MGLQQPAKLPPAILGRQERFDLQTEQATMSVR